MYQRMKDEDRQATIWVQTAEEAIGVLKDYMPALRRIYLDHDLGGRQFVHSSREDCGMEVVRFLEKQDAKKLEGCEIVVHTWNTPAGLRMEQRLRHAGYKVNYKPFGS